MFIVVLIMISGMAIGYLLRNRRIGFVSYAITFLIWLLLFLLGIEVGSNPKIVGGLRALGIEALLISVMATLGSVVGAWLFWRCLKNKQE